MQTNCSYSKTDISTQELLDCVIKEQNTAADIVIWAISTVFKITAIGISMSMAENIKYLPKYHSIPECITICATFSEISVFCIYRVTEKLEEIYLYA